MRILPISLMLVVVCARSQGQDRCGLAKDLVVQSLENVKVSASASDLADGIQLLKQAHLACPTMGDAWYYRSLFEQKAGHQQLADFARKQAEIAGSDAMRDGLDPFRLAAPTTLANSIGPLRQKWALVVGVGHFRDKANNLPYTKKDAEDFAAALKDSQIGRFQEDHVRVLTNGDATLVNVKAGLNWIARQAEPDDIVVVYVASHGTARRSDSVGHLNYILTTDTDASDEDNMYGSALPMVELSEVIRSRIKALRTVVVLDACHSGGSGGLLRAASPSTSMMDRMKSGTGRVILAAARENERSFESESLENGIFTHFLIEGLKQKSGDLPLSAVFQYVEQQVSTYARTEAHAEQTPVMFEGDGGANIVLGATPASATFSGRLSAWSVRGLPSQQ